MKDNKEIDSKIINLNITKILENLTRAEKIEGECWYNEMNYWCRNVAQKFMIHENQVIALVAVFSPMKTVELNKTLVLEFLSSGCKDCGHLKAQVKKAQEIMITTNSTELRKIISGRKTVSFYDNISRSTNCAVTVDRHMMKLAPSKWNGRVTPNRYNLIEACVVAMANKLRESPYNLQAKLWLKLQKGDFV